jgi:lysophospholipase L1-like esterase
LFCAVSKINFRFRNSGVGGDTIPKAIARFDWDAAPWKPTLISVELGMNDKGSFTTEKYLENMLLLHEKIVGISARAVYISASPVNNGDTSDSLGVNTRLHEYANALKKFAEDKSSPFADQFHDLLDVWGKNKPREMILTLKGTITAALAVKNLAGSEHLKAYLAEIEKDTQPIISMQGDPVHPGPPGQLMMAASILKNLNADPFVSSATLDATGKVIEAKACLIEDAKIEKEILSFSRLDESVPFPIPQGTRQVISLCPTILELSDYTLKITGLTAEKYNIKINTVLVTTLTAKELEAGVNLTNIDKGPFFTQSAAILGAVNTKESIVGQWRMASKLASVPSATDEVKEKAETLKKAVEDADQKIRLAAKPIKLNFEVAPAK